MGTVSHLPAWLSGKAIGSSGNTATLAFCLQAEGVQGWLCMHPSCQVSHGPAHSSKTLAWVSSGGACPMQSVTPHAQQETCSTKLGCHRSFLFSPFGHSKLASEQDNSLDFHCFSHNICIHSAKSRQHPAPFLVLILFLLLQTPFGGPPETQRSPHSSRDTTRSAGQEHSHFNSHLSH